MIKQAFLTREEIKALQAQEAASTKEQKRTPEQIDAIYSSGTNILVSASAGSGKTFVMVQRILDQMQRGISIKELFISTFTVKAAGELKERLESELGKALQASDDPELKQHLARQIADVATSDIGTMDSFTQKVLTRYGYLLGLAPQFRILQNASEQRLLQNEVFQAVFDRYYQGENQEAFVQMVKNFTGQRKNLTLFKEQVYQIYDFLQSTSDPEKWLEEHFLKGYEETDFDQVEGDLMESIQQALYEAESFFAFHLSNEGQAFGKAKYLEAVEEVLDQIGSLTGPTNKEQLTSVLKAVVAISRASNGGALTNRARKEELKELVTAYNQDKTIHINRLRDLENQLYQLEFQQTFHQEEGPMLSLLRDFIRDFARAYLERKIQEKAYEFGDISHFAIQILEQFPEVRQAFQERYHEVMVDEYQDTNHTQERMLDLLSNGHNRFMVGDIKQSIYRFRQADPQIFNDKFKAYQEEGAKGRLILLKENFRSHVEVLDATNDVFRHLMDEEVGEIDYNQTHYLVAGSDKQRMALPQHRAEFLLYDGSQDQEEKTEDEEAASGLETVSKGEILLVIKEILRLHRVEKVPFKEITLLTATRTRNDAILESFDQYHIPIVADSGQAHYLESLEVMVMLDTLRTINNPLHDYPLVALMKSPMFDFDEDELARISLQTLPEQKQMAFYHKVQLALEKTAEHANLIDAKLLAKIENFLKVLSAWRAAAKTSSLYDLLWKIYEDRYYYDYVGALPNGAQRQANLYALTLRANDYEKASFKGLSRFIAMIDKVIENEHDLASVPLVAPKDAVQLMTVHKSKGLEFKYVFILNMDKAFNRKDQSGPIILSRQKGIGFKYVASLPVETENPATPETIRLQIETPCYQRNVEETKLATISEQMRLLYVAMTRAELKLYLVGKGREDKLRDTDWGTSRNGKLDPEKRKEWTSYQDWLFAIQDVFTKNTLAYDTRFVTDEDLTPDQLEPLEKEKDSRLDQLKDVRQSEDIRRALDILENVDRLNQLYAPAIHLPSVRTPSQIKKFYEPVMDANGVQIMDAKTVTPEFELPTFGQEKAVTGAQVGSAVHELMQRVPLEEEITLDTLHQALEQVQAEPAVKAHIKLEAILAFYETPLGTLLQKEASRVRREAPFAMLKKDPASGEDFVVRGILDGYLVLEDRILLFDYKTDHYEVPSQLVERYRDQLDLYAEALRRSYGKEQVEKYLVLLGGPHLEVVKVE